MARRHRIFIPDVSLHVIQRGNNGMTVFRQHEDYRRFLAFLRWAASGHRVGVHAFVLMTTHVHLIVTPADALGLPAMMKELGGRYVRYHNRKYDRFGSLWSGRYRGLLIHDERYWLTCLRYVEQNAVRAGMVTSPDAYAWSSYAAHASGQWPEWLAPHPVYLSLGPTPEERQAAYRALCGELLADDQLATVRCASDGVRRGSDPRLTPV